MKNLMDIESSFAEARICFDESLEEHFVKLLQVGKQAQVRHASILCELSYLEETARTAPWQNASRDAAVDFATNIITRLNAKIASVLLRIAHNEDVSDLEIGHDAGTRTVHEKFGIPIREIGMIPVVLSARPEVPAALLRTLRLSNNERPYVAAAAQAVLETLFFPVRCEIANAEKGD